MSAQPSVFAWPILLGVGSSLLPALAAVRARRSLLRDPAGQVGAAWLVMAASSVAQIAAAASHHMALVARIGAATIVLQGALLAPPLTTWAGPRAVRLRPALLAGFAAVAAALWLAFGSGRAFVVFMMPFMSVFLLALVLWALVTQSNRHGRSTTRAPWRCDWFWIGIGHLAYGLAALVRMPLVETLVARNYQAVVDLHMGFMLLDALALCVVAYGITRPAEEPHAEARLALAGARA